MKKTAYNRQGIPIYSCPTSKAYKENYEKIFGTKKDLEELVYPEELGGKPKND